MHNSAFSHSTSAKPVVLVVDDFEPILELMRAGLREYGFDVWVASDGRQAIELWHELSERDHDAGTFVLLDVRMPGLDGPTVLAALQSIDPEVQAYFMTANAGEYSEDDLLARGAQRVFIKPLNIAEVAAEFRRSMSMAHQG